MSTKPYKNSDPYDLLGVDKTATDSDIKSAYRKLAKKWHPDTPNGDAKKFNEVNTAYESIKDVNARFQQEQQQHTSNPHNWQHKAESNPFNNHNTPPGFDSMFDSMFGRQQKYHQRNQDVEITAHVTLEEVLNESQKNLNINLMNGNFRTVTIHIPRGVHEGSKIRYNSMGDDSVPGPPGNLIVTYRLKKHNRFWTDGYNLNEKINISLKTALFGGDIPISGIDGSQFKLNIKAGTSPNTKLRIPQHGLPQPNQPNGDLILHIDVSIPPLTVDNLNTPIGELLE